jgi:high-affinity Fe2+/Pb2+ permease
MNFTEKEEVFTVTTEYIQANQRKLIGISWLGMIQSLVVAAVCLLLIFKVVRKINEAKFHWLMVSMLLTN